MNQVTVHADFLSALIANSRDACVMLDPDLIITISNAEAAGLFGMHPDGLLSLRLDTLIPRGIPENGFPQSESGSFEGHCLDSTKRKIPIRICSYPVPEGNGTLVVLKRLQPGNKENPQALKEGQKQLRNYLNSAASMFVVLRPDYKISLVNQKVCDILGYPAEELLDQNWLTFLGSPKDRKRLKLLFDRTLKGKSKLSDSFETYVLSQKGEKRLIRWQNALLKDADGMNTGLVCSGEDISAQKEAELELVQSEARNRAILEAIPDAILLHDQNGKVLSVQESNPTGAIFNPEKLVGQTVTEAFPGETGHQMLQKIRDSCLKEQSTILEITADGDQGRQYFEIRYACMENGQVLAVARDITRTKNTQQILDLRNRALEAAGNGILISDARLPDMPIIYSNEAFSRITGYAREEVLGKNCRFLQGADTDREKVRAIREALEKGVPSRVVLRNYRKDGSLFWNELTITPIEDAGGGVTHFIGVQNDVSTLVFEGERKDYTRKILEAITQDRPLKEISEGIADFLGNLEPETGLLISLWHTDKQCLESLASYRLPGPVEEKFKRIPLKKQKRCPCIKAVLTRDTVILEDLDRDTGAIPFIKALKDQGIRSYWSYPILSSERKVLGTCTFFGRKPGEPGKEQLELLKDALQLTGLAIERYQTRRRIEESNRKLEQYAKNLEKDVAERTREVESTVQKLLETNISLQEQIQTTRQMEERATASLALFGAIARHFPKGVIMVFDKELKYEHLEGEELERMGLKDWDFTGKSVMDTPELSPSKLMDLRTRINQTLKGKHLSFELQLDENTYSVNSSPLSVGVGMRLALFVFSNVTELKRAEEDLLRALRIEQELNDMKSRFISMASHEFRTPLSAIHSSAILIGKQNEPGYEEKRLRYLKQIQNNVRNLVVILDDFLSLGKLEEGKLECQPENFDLLDLIRSVLEEMESNLKVGQHFHEDFEITSMQVHLDPKLMRHILVNLLSNAIKYSQENSAIFIHIRADADFLNVSVKDEGMGIPEEEHEQLFNRFFRAKNSVNIPGTGLGLHIVKHYTELMGGSIRFKSSLDEGSTFYLSLPVRFKPAAHEKDSDH
ncbi:MAG: PAS domain S-box protein [Flavobacteriaceae bacterium]|nr:MAG: PAS domain S-box protein [Flavobacteriaceae bacterium]